MSFVPMLHSTQVNRPSSASAPAKSRPRFSIGRCPLVQELAQSVSVRRATIIRSRGRGGPTDPTPPLVPQLYGRIHEARSGRPCLDVKVPLVFETCFHFT